MSLYRLNHSKALQRRVIRVSEMFKEHRSSKEKSSAIAELDSLLATSETNLFVERSSNVNRTSNCTTYHRVVTDAEESHHLNVCWN